jgi:DNA primase
MRQLSNTTRPISSGEVSWEDGDITTSSSRKEEYKALIEKANSVPIIKLFNYYNLNISEINKQVTCPFPSHLGGREASASFKYYEETNTFFCFGCKKGVRPCDFVANMDDCSRRKAAAKILELLDPDEALLFSSENAEERLELMMDFSNFIRENIKKNEHDISLIENICTVYDSLNTRYKLSNEALKNLISKLKNKYK